MNKGTPGKLKGVIVSKKSTIFGQQSDKKKGEATPNKGLYIPLGGKLPAKRKISSDTLTPK